jgi:hypothetical protein
MARQSHTRRTTRGLNLSGGLTLSESGPVQVFKCIAIKVHFGEDRPMKTTCGRQWLFVATALALSGVRATADDANSGEPLIQARFDQLIPRSYPTIRPGFDRLIQTTLPLSDPGIARVPITENLVRPLDQPLLSVNEGLGQLPATRPKRESIPEHRQRSASRPAPARSSGKTR